MGDGKRCPGCNIAIAHRSLVSRERREGGMKAAIVSLLTWISSDDRLSWWWRCELESKIGYTIFSQLRKRTEKEKQTSWNDNKPWFEHVAVVVDASKWVREVDMLSSCPYVVVSEVHLQRNNSECRLLSLVVAVVVIAALLRCWWFNCRKTVSYEIRDLKKTQLASVIVVVVPNHLCGWRRYN